MKTMTAVFAAALTMAGATGHAQTGDYFATRSSHQTVDLTRARTAYQACLDASNPGVQESAIAHLIWLKMQRPDADLSPLRESLDRLAVSGTTTTVRFRAYLATLMLDSAVIFDGLDGEAFASGEELFEAMAARLQKTLLGYSDRRYVRER